MKMSYSDKSICYVILVVSWIREISMGRKLTSSGGESTFGIPELFSVGCGLESDQMPNPMLGTGYVKSICHVILIASGSLEQVSKRWEVTSSGGESLMCSWITCSLGELDQEQPPNPVGDIMAYPPISWVSEATLF